MAHRLNYSLYFRVDIHCRSFAFSTCSLAGCLVFAGHIDIHHSRCIAQASGNYVSEWWKTNCEKPIIIVGTTLPLIWSIQSFFWQVRCSHAERQCMAHVNRIIFSVQWVSGSHLRYLLHTHTWKTWFMGHHQVFFFFSSFAQCYKQKCAAMKGVLFDVRHWISYKWFCWIPVWNSKNTVLPRVEILLKLHLNQRNITSEHHQRSLNKSSSPYFSFLEEDESISFFFYFW